VFELQHRKNHARVVEFLTALRGRVLVDRKPAHIDFSNTHRMVACGTLLFMAELFRMKKYLGSLQLVTCTHPSDNTVAQVLQHLGILDMLNCRSRVTPKRPDVINWRVASGENTDAQEAGTILESQSKLPEQQSKRLYRGVSEAMTNVSQHAYLDTRQDGANIAGDKGWWMFCREEDDHIFVTFCDLGIGIPETLPRTQEQGLFKAVLERLGIGKPTDGTLIQAAIEIKRSRTQQRHRGKGLLDMLKAIETAQGGRLTIFSNRGGYSFKSGNSGSSEEIKSFKHSILNFIGNQFSGVLDETDCRQ
jgi:anti-sigma regulatory factor (Ser/Thr protein kinase)